MNTQSRLLLLIRDVKLIAKHAVTFNNHSFGREVYLLLTRQLIKLVKFYFDGSLQDNIDAHSSTVIILGHFSNNYSQDKYKVYLHQTVTRHSLLYQSVMKRQIFCF